MAPKNGSAPFAIAAARAALSARMALSRQHSALTSTWLARHLITLA